MRTAVLTDTEQLEIVERNRPQPGPDEVLVRIQEVGVCGSDVHYWRHGRIGEYVVEGPLVLGHESAGEVIAVGDEVDTVAPGERVTVEPGIPCRHCRYCSTGRYHLCPDVTFMATPPDDGAFAEYVTWPEALVYPLPDSVSIRDGALCEPLSVGLHATELAGIDPGDSVLITGCGPIGLLTLEVVRAAGATDVIVTDVVAEKLERARSHGATRAVNVEEESVSDAVGDVTDGVGVETVIEASGAPSAYDHALDAVAPGGTIVCVGLAPDGEIPIDLVAVTLSEIRIQGSIRYSNTYPAAVGLLAEGEVEVSWLVDDVFELDAVQEAFYRATEPDIVKVMVTL